MITISLYKTEGFTVNVSKEYMYPESNEWALYDMTIRIRVSGI